MATHDGELGEGPQRASAHVPVMAGRVLELLAPALQPTAGEPAVVVDATVGLGGHAELLLAAFPEVRLVGLDRDPAALELARRRLGGEDGRVALVHAVYDRIADVLAELGSAPVRGVLFDLGVSSMQLDQPDRGFSYSREAPLDMRMDPSTGQTAADVVNTYSVAELTRLLREYGEERFARRIAQAISAERARRPLDSTGRLVELIREAVPAPARREGGHPAKRTFQALRIEVNDELGALRRAVPAALGVLAVGGRLVVLSYQSLEDRIVKRALVALATDTTPPGMPVSLPANAPQLRLLTRRAEQASDDEVLTNPRAASVRLRAAERVREAA